MFTMLSDVSTQKSFTLALSDDSLSVDNFLEQMDIGPSSLPHTPSRSNHSTPQPGMDIDPLIGYSAGPTNMQELQLTPGIIQNQLAGPSNMQEPQFTPGIIQNQLASPSNAQELSSQQFGRFQPVTPQPFQQMPPPPTPLLPPAVQAVISVTPEKKKIERILSQRQFQKVSNAGRLAVALAMHMFGEKVLLVSSVTGDHGRRKALDEEKISEIEKVIVAMYQGKVNDIEQLWKGCKTAISKKCQSL